MIPALDTSATGFSLVNARACAEASRLAYNTANITDARTDTQVNITGDANGNVIIAFRGTSNLADFLTDAEAWRSSIEGCEIHFGFLCAIRNVLVPITDALDKILGKKNIFVTGHSLGGALAMLCAAEFALDGVIVHSVYTFGQPRVGNGAFQKRYNAALGARTFRVIHEQDIVPRVPFLVLGYRGTETRVFLDSFGGLQVNPPLWKIWLSDICGELRAYHQRNLIAALEPLNDHAMEQYLARLSA